MKIRSLVFVSLFISQSCFAIDYWVNKSSNVTAAQTTQHIVSAEPGAFLGSVLVNKRAAFETLTIYDSSAAANKSLGVIDLSTGSTGTQYIYNLRVSSGITVSKVGTNSDITILWNSMYRQ